MGGTLSCTNIQNEALLNDLQLIKSCLRLINSSIKASDYDFTTDKDIHNAVAGIDNMLNRIKKNIGSDI
jgi:hypothetical protein